MTLHNELEKLAARFITVGDHRTSDYFALIRELVKRLKSSRDTGWEKEIDRVYTLVADELASNTAAPQQLIKFGTSGWRGILGKDVFVRSVACVTHGIVAMYRIADGALLKALGVSSYEDAKKRGCVLGHDNRFGGGLLAATVAKVLSDAGFTVHFAGESTTGVLSAAVLELGAAFSVNLTPSHNPLEYGGYKFNGADAGPAGEEVTSVITRLARESVEKGEGMPANEVVNLNPTTLPGVVPFDSLATWKNLVRRNGKVHGLDLDSIMAGFAANSEMVVAVDSMHGASRLHMVQLLPEAAGGRLIFLRDQSDVTFGGIAPEPSSVNMQGVQSVLSGRKERFKLGAIIDPDGDRIRFADGTNEISMNQFGAMAYHFLVKYKHKKGMIAKTVATSNMANCLARAFGEELFEPRVGFKEFKPVIGRALVFFEESDGISIIGHTPEKDAYIGLLLAMDMVLTTGMNLGEYRDAIEKEYGAYFPDRDGVTVSVQGSELLKRLKQLEIHEAGNTLMVGAEEKMIAEVITIDGRKMIFEDGSWLMIRPSGTEPKVRFYVESRTDTGTRDLVETARTLLHQIGLV